MKIKYTSIIVLLLLIMTASACGQGNKNKAQDKAKDASQSVNMAPEFTGRDITTGKDLSLKDFRGKAVLVNFWATWCPPCKAEIPDLIELQKKYGDRFTVIGASVDQDGVDGVKAFVKKYQITYPVIMATPDMVNQYGGISAIPTSFVVSKKGEAAVKIVGFRNKSQYEEILLPYINGGTN